MATSPYGCITGFSIGCDKLLDSSGFIIPAPYLPPSNDEPAYALSDLSFGVASTPSGTSPAEPPDDPEFIWPTASESGTGVEAPPSEPEPPMDFESVLASEIKPESFDATPSDIPSRIGADFKGTLYPTLRDEILEYERLRSKSKLKKREKEILRSYQSRCDAFLIIHSQTCGSLVLFVAVGCVRWLERSRNSTFRNSHRERNLDKVRLAPHSMQQFIYLGFSVSSSLA